MFVHYTTVSSDGEVQQILDLQALNHASVLGADTMREQGFLTVRHEPDVLLRMNRTAPAIIAKAGEQVVGYALVMPREFAAEVPVLLPMFAMLDKLEWNNEALRANPRWFVMGQICVADGYRGQGIFDGMYLKMKEVCREQYDFTITEVAERNTRSIRAHERVGFQTLHQYPDETSGERWRVVILEF